MEKDVEISGGSRWSGLIGLQFQPTYKKLRLRLNNWRTRIAAYRQNQSTNFELLVWLACGTAAALATSSFHNSLQPYLGNEKFVNVLSGTALQLGAALLGASAIVASFVLFAMQVNVERLPHGLFRRLSEDKRLLLSFAGAFLASIMVASLPLVTPIHSTEWAIFAAVLLTFTTLRLFLFAYKRALMLINPVQQLRIILDDVTVALKRWGMQADWYSAARVREEPKAPANPLIDSTLDTGRAAFLLQNAWGSDVAQQGIDHCIAVNGKSASQGDYQVAGDALTALVNINVLYVQAKGRTFFSENGIFDVPFSTDAIVMHSLEQLKRQFRAGLGRRDEQHVNMILKAYGDLAQIYTQIDYGRPEENPWHASLAIGYLINDIKSIIPHNLPDCLMLGVRILGGCAVALINRDKATAIELIVDAIGPFGAAMTVREDHRPVAVTATEQLAGLTFHMVNNGVFDPGYTFGQISIAVQFIATRALEQPNPALTSVHRLVLGPYFSPTSETSLGSRLKRVANALLECPAGDDRAGNCVANLHEWAERTMPMAKALMVLALEKRSPFTFDILHWIKDIIEVLLAAARAPVSEEHFCVALEEQAHRWTLVLSWIPDDAESLDCAATWSGTSVMFEIAEAATKWHSEKVYEAAQRNLLRWALRSSRRENAWHNVEEAMLALAAVALKSPRDADGALLKSQLGMALQAEHIPPAILLQGAAQGLRRSIDDYDQDHMRTRRWDHVLKAEDPGKRRKLLTDLAEILENANQG